jgi:hypothetical protein
MATERCTRAGQTTAQQMKSVLSAQNIFTSLLIPHQSMKSSQPNFEVHIYIFTLDHRLNDTQYSLLLITGHSQNCLPSMIHKTIFNQKMLFNKFCTAGRQFLK